MPSPDRSPNLAPLIDARFVRRLDTEIAVDRSAIIGYIPVYKPIEAVIPASLDPAAAVGPRHEAPTDNGGEPPHPWPVEDCRRRAYSAIGLWRLRTIYNCRRDWWDRLRAATTPEEKLTCERMINAFGEAIGLHQHERGARYSENNPFHGESGEPYDPDARAVDRWR